MQINSIVKKREHVEKTNIFGCWDKDFEDRIKPLVSFQRWGNILAETQLTRKYLKAEVVEDTCLAGQNKTRYVRG